MLQVVLFMSIKNKLNLYKKHLVNESEKNSQSSKTDDHTIPFLEQWTSFSANPYFFDDQYCLIREVSYPIGYKHGQHSFAELHEVIEMWQSHHIQHPLSAKNKQPHDLFFFDTETTGLGGGVGNTIFLLGYARVFQDEVKIRQHFLPAPGNEVALYQSFLTNVDYTTLVTYNGKAFDWPQVKTRHTLIKESVPKLPEFGHFDLFHASRRLWKNELENVRLTTVEKEKLVINRGKDTPGYLAPLLYFDFLQNKNPTGIFSVLRHNETDVLSLISLYIHLSKKLLANYNLKNPNEQFEIARWLDTLGEKQSASHKYKAIATSEDEHSDKAKFNLAMIYKREKNVKKAIDLWKQLVESNDMSLQIQAAVELAKVYEHQFKEIDIALEYARLAYNITSDKDEYKKNKKAELLKRISRLEKKGK
ncbi:ribonuclease H-like domain-containing protein [Bacillus sp. SM2101]|uniref:ribonuclease H-like domain-containing protein n=1 Tax=Bacillus sp. SM2101 TaxID=2805366 RepID=UPI002032896D|nr:ribonuclease H-like domain-containing protein [Bacillus sp. SM2101]